MTIGKKQPTSTASVAVSGVVVVQDVNYTNGRSDSVSQIIVRHFEDYLGEFMEPKVNSGFLPSLSGITHIDITSGEATSRGLWLRNTTTENYAIPASGTGTYYLVVEAEPATGTEDNRNPVQDGVVFNLMDLASIDYSVHVVLAEVVLSGTGLAESLTSYVATNNTRVDRIYSNQSSKVEIYGGIFPTASAVVDIVSSGVNIYENLWLTGSGVLSGTLNVIGTSSFSGILNVSGTGSFSGILNTDTINVANTSLFNGNVVVSGSNIILDYSQAYMSENSMGVATSLIKADYDDLVIGDNTVWDNIRLYSIGGGGEIIINGDTITSGIWNGTDIDSAYIDSTLAVTTLTASGLITGGDINITGTSSTIGTVTSGIWSGTIIDSAKIDQSLSVSSLSAATITSTSYVRASDAGGFQLSSTSNGLFKHTQVELRSSADMRFIIDYDSNSTSHAFSWYNNAEGVEIMRLTEDANLTLMGGTQLRFYSDISNFNINADNNANLKLNSTGSMYFYVGGGADMVINNGSVDIIGGLNIDTTGTHIEMDYSGTTYGHIYYTTVGADGVYIKATTSGGVYLANGATSWASASDIRFKDNVKIVSVLDKILAVDTIEYDLWEYDKEGIKQIGLHQIGVSAQSLQKQFPMLVFGKETEDEKLSVDYSHMSALLFSGFKELNDKIEILNVKIKKLQEQ
jgi:hypothetical protein